jgi:signal transduction histidine kinase
MSQRDPIHEMRNYLSIVLGFVELLLVDTSDGDRRREDLLEIKQAADRAMALLPELSLVPHKEA